MDEYEEGFEYFYITSDRFVDGVETKDEYLEHRRKTFGIYFKTRDVAGDCLAYLKARAIIKQDAKGFKPNFTNIKERKYYGFWDFESGKQNWAFLHITKEPNIYFKSLDDILDSFEAHPEEWKTYLTYEQ